MGLNSPKILHIDFNSYFATMEQQAYPNLRGKPVGVAGKGKGERTVVVAVSKEAKKFGLYSGIPSWEAKKLCPEIILVPADYSRYSYTSQRFFSLLQHFSPQIEVFSIDECFVNLGTEPSWDDAIAIGKQIKRLISTQIGEWVTCSIGISYGRTLAKLAGELEKPDNLTVITQENFPEVAKKTKIEKISGIGWRIGPRLNQLGIRTIAELGQFPREALVSAFGNHTGNWLHFIGNGIDSKKLQSFHELPQEKSVGHSYTLPRDIYRTEDVRRTILLLSERVAVRLRRKNLMGRAVSVYLRFDDRTGWGSQVMKKAYFNDGYEIYKLVLVEIEKSPPRRAIRLCAVTVSSLCQQRQLSKPLFPEIISKENLVLALDKINNRYGELTVYRSGILSVKNKIKKLPDGRVGRHYIPNISEINPFIKRF